MADAGKQIATAQVVRKGVFDAKDFYVAMWSFMKDTLGYGFSEDQYSQWETSYGTAIEFHWTFTREQEDYVHYRIWIECKFRGLKKVKVPVNGKSKSMDKGEVEFNIKGVLILDPGNKWGSHPILKHFKDWLYEKRIYKDQIEDYIERLWEHVYNLEGEAKAFFDLPKFT